MNRLLLAVLLGLSLVARAGAQPASTTATNAALRYWMAFAVMKDPLDAKSSITRELMDRITAATAPLDSRITKWLNEFGFPVWLSATALGDGNCYAFVMDGV